MQRMVQHVLNILWPYLQGVARKPALLGAILLGVLLIQPFLCFIHCSADAHFRPAAVNSSYTRHFLCTFADNFAPPQAHTPPLPAFWPSLPTPPSIVVVGLTLLLVLPLIPPLQRRSINWAPPLPPPRGVWASYSSGQRD